MNISHKRDADNSTRSTRSSCSSPSKSFSHGIPFSWEQQPGIPKHQQSKAGASTRDRMLPLPPAAAPSTKYVKKKSAVPPDHHLMERDPFIAALMECSKDLGLELEDIKYRWWKGAKVSRSLSDRFDFGSCKRLSCSVIDSTILLEKPNRPGYHLLDRRSS